MAITWRNVNAPGFGSAVAASEVGGESLNRGLDKLASIGEGFKQENVDQFNKEKAANTETLLSELSNFKDSESLDAALRDGAFAESTLAGRFGDRVDLGKVRNSREALSSQLYTQGRARTADARTDADTALSDNLDGILNEAVSAIGTGTDFYSGRTKLNEQFARAGASPAQIAKGNADYKALFDNSLSLSSADQAAVARESQVAAANADVGLTILEEEVNTAKGLVDARVASGLESNTRQDVMGYIDQLATDQSWTGWLTEWDQSGSNLREMADGIMTESFDGNPVEPWMVREAITLLQEQGDVDAEDFRAKVKALATDIEGNKRIADYENKRAKFNSARLGQARTKADAQSNILRDMQRQNLNR